VSLCVFARRFEKANEPNPADTADNGASFDFVSLSDDSPQEEPASNELFVL
jgi:hypothetical protein